MNNIKQTGSFNIKSKYVKCKTEGQDWKFNQKLRHGRNSKRYKLLNMVGNRAPMYKLDELISNNSALYLKDKNDFS